MRANIVPLLILGPLIVGTGAVLLSRIAGDLSNRLTLPPAAGWLGWSVCLLVAASVVRRTPCQNGQMTEWLAVSDPCQRVDRALAAWFRLIPLVVAMAVVAATVHSPLAVWMGILLLWWGMPWLAGANDGVGQGLGVLRGRMTRHLAWGLSQPLPRRLRPLVQRDLVRLARGFALLQWVYLAVGVTAWLAGLERLLYQPEAGQRVGMLAGLMAAWAVSASLSPLLVYERGRRWPELDAAVSAHTLWWGKAVTATILGLAVGVCNALLWWQVAPGLALLHLGLGATAGLCVGITLMEGDQRPLWHGVISLLVSLMVGVLGMLQPVLLLLAPLLATYLAQIGIPRLAVMLAADAERL